jgi:hypothetical protein
MSSEFVHPDHIDRRMPWDDLEPIPDEHDELRDAAIKYISIINAFSERIERAITEPGATVRGVATAYYSVALALGLNSIAGRSFTEIARLWNVERATLSKSAVSFIQANGLEPSWAMKKAETSIAFTQARLRSIAEHNGAELPPVPAVRGRSV